MTDVIVILVLLFIVGGAGFYIWRVKKRGDNCIGCPHAKECRKSSCCSAIQKNKENKEK